jgi:phage baseplate assembly protein W
MTPPAGQGFLGSGLAWPIESTVTGELQRASHEEAVRQAVWIILSTSKGERPMRPDFGCGIHDLVFQTMGPATAGQLVDAVRDALLRHEPRIDVREVQVQPGTDPGVLLIVIDYEIRATNSAFNLVYPFYLQAGGG